MRLFCFWLQSAFMDLRTQMKEHRRRLAAAERDVQQKEQDRKHLEKDDFSTLSLLPNLYEV
jgi:hypothetical protein